MRTASDPIFRRKKRRNRQTFAVQRQFLQWIIAAKLSIYSIKLNFLRFPVVLDKVSAGLRD